jgi:hypothetical protein
MRRSLVVELLHQSAYAVEPDVPLLYAARTQVELRPSVIPIAMCAKHELVLVDRIMQKKLGCLFVKDQITLKRQLDIPVPIIGLMCKPKHVLDVDLLGSGAVRMGVKHEALGVDPNQTFRFHPACPTKGPQNQPSLKQGLVCNCVTFDINKHRIVNECF